MRSRRTLGSAFSLSALLLIGSAAFAATDDHLDCFKIKDTLAPSMRLPWVLMLAALTFYYFAVLIVRIRSELLAAKIRNARMSQIAVGGAPQMAE